MSEEEPTYDREEFERGDFLKDFEGANELYNNPIFVQKLKDDGGYLYEKNKAAYEEAAKKPLIELKNNENEMFPNLSPAKKSLLRNYPSAAETDEEFAYVNYLDRMKKQWEYYAQASAYVWQLPEQEIKMKKVPMSPDTRAALIFALMLLFCVTGLIAFGIAIASSLI